MRLTWTRGDTVGLSVTILLALAWLWLINGC